MNNKILYISVTLSVLAILLSVYNFLNPQKLTVEEFDEMAIGFAERMENKEKEAVKEKAKNIDLISDRDHVFGPKNADITIFEYSDFECPFCKKFSKVPYEVVEKYQGKVNSVFRHFPLSFHEPLASMEANAAECAYEQGGDDKFFAFKDKIFERTESNNGLDPKELFVMADELGLNKKEFETCMSEMRYADKIKNDIESGIKAGVRGTPGVFIRNNKTGEVESIPGAVDADYLSNIIDQMLN